MPVVLLNARKSFRPVALSLNTSSTMNYSKSTILNGRDPGRVDAFESSKNLRGDPGKMPKPLFNSYDVCAAEIPSARYFASWSVGLFSEFVGTVDSLIYDFPRRYR